jgi:hypothetical protein
MTLPACDLARRQKQVARQIGSPGCRGVVLSVAGQGLLLVAIRGSERRDGVDPRVGGVRFVWVGWADACRRRQRDKPDEVVSRAREHNRTRFS